MRTSPAERTGSRVALVLSGGGARGAYQVGVLRGMLELGLSNTPDHRFEILVGSSAGAINASLLAAFADDYQEGVGRLESVWGSLEPRQVFRTDLRSLGGIGAAWIRDLSFGGLLRRVAPKSLLDTAPLRTLLTDRVPFERIGRHVETGHLRALAVPATDLYTANGVVFLEAAPEVPLWKRGRWTVERTSIRTPHVLASAAIPVFFPSVEIGGRHLGDGSVRNTAPLSPAINLGADRIVAVGVRQTPSTSIPPEAGKPPSIAQVAGSLLDAVLLDAVAIDVEHGERVNASVLACPRPLDHSDAQPFRLVDILWISPTRPFHDIAREFASHIPAVVRYLMRGLGSDEETTDLASYLLFDGAFCRRLMEIGREDVLERREEIRGFLTGGKQASA